MPPFFIQGVGGTPTGQIIVFMATLLFFASVLMILRQYTISKSLMLYWYGFGLILLSIGMAEILVQSTTGSPLNWVGRISQILGGLYLATAAFVTYQTAKAKEITPEEALTSFFTVGSSHI